MFISIEDFLRQIPGGVQVNGQETAFPISETPKILDIASKNQWIILGGDVLTMQGEYALANWYYEPKAECPLSENANQSIEKSRAFISDYVKRNGSDWLVVFVISNSYVAGG